MLRIKEIIQKRNTTSKQLAEKLDITETSLSRIVKGVQFPKPELLKQIADTLDVDIRELFVPTKESASSAHDFTCPYCGGKIKVSKE